MKRYLLPLFSALLLCALLLTACGGGTDPTETKEPRTTETAPGQTEPAETEPEQTEPVETEPAETEPAETEPAETEPAETEPAETEPTETEPAETEPAETEPTETEPAETEPAETEPPETEPPETEPQPKGDIIVSEVCSRNTDVFTPKSGMSGYVELTNPGNTAVKLSVFTVQIFDSNGENRKQLYVYGTLESGACKIAEIPAGYEAGGTVIISGGDGGKQVISFPALSRNLSYSRFDDGWRVTTPTAGLENDEAITNYLLINEVCSSNKNAITDAAGKTPDYVELYNPTPYPLSLRGYVVGDNKNAEEGYSLPDVTIEPYGYLLVFADKDSTLPLHAPFGISANGEKVYLFDPSGERMQKVEVPALGEDECYGRYPDGGEFRVCSCTPGASNDTAKLSIMAPVLSAAPGFYNDPFTLTMTADPGYTIFYTTDGTTPTTSSTRYVTGIAVKDKSPEANLYSSSRELTVMTSDNGSFVCQTPVDKCTVIKAIAVNAQGEVSDMVTGVYFIGYQNRTGYSNVTIMSLSTDPAYLFDYNIGIYVKGYIYDTKGNGGNHPGNTQANYKQKGDAWEREVTMTVFDPDGSYAFSQQVGIRIHGGWSRGFNQKSLNVYCRKEYGSNTVLEPFFDTDKLKSFMLRTGGYRDTFYTKMRDPLNQKLIADRPRVATQDSRACVLFLNGEYWGVYALQERFTSSYVEENYGVDKDDVVMIRMGGLEEGTAADKALWDNMINYFKSTNLADPAAYAKACELIDVQGFIEYMAMEIYACNADWPTNNFRAWRSRTVTDEPYHDGRWRFMLYDTDDCADVPDIGGKVTANADGFANSSHWAGGPLDASGHLGAILTSLLKNADFREQFVTTFCDLCNVNFRYERVHAIITEMAKEYGEPMVNFYHRWVTADKNRNLDFFNKQVTTLDNFFKARRDIICKYMVQHFKELKYTELNAGEATVTVKHDKTTCAVSFNTVPADSLPEDFTGRYYVGLHVSATATALDGYTVTGWRVTQNGVTTTQQGASVVVSLVAGTLTLEPIVE